MGKLTTMICVTGSYNAEKGATAQAKERFLAEAKAEAGNRTYAVTQLSTTSSYSVTGGIQTHTITAVIEWTI